jgi:serpin B
MKMNSLIGLVLAAAVFGAGTEKPQPAQEPGVECIIEGNTEFAMRLYQRLMGQEGNLFFSPYSISTALAMVYGGAGSQTAEQMQQALQFGPNAPAFHQAYGQLIAGFNKQGQKGDYQLSVANALWMQADYRFRDAYLDLVGACYDAGLERLDFVAAADKATETINAWVEDKTQGKITDLIAPGSLDARTRLVLTNAIYFKGNWAEQFDKKQTRQAPFYVSPDETVQAPLMHRKGDYRYAEREGLQVLQMPYKGDDLSMVVLLPERSGLGQLQPDLTAETLKEWTRGLRVQEVEVYLPKFTMTSKFELGKVLAAMGMPLAFTQAADFSGMTGNQDLFISQVVHKAYVDVNEEGTEAAAATGVQMRVTSMPMPAPVFRADRPFLFVIKDNVTGSILFIGRVVKPVE